VPATIELREDWKAFDAARLGKLYPHVSDPVTGARLENVRAGTSSHPTRGMTGHVTADIHVGKDKVGSLSRVYYPDTNTVVRERTSVDEAHQGRGIASGLHAAEEQGLRVAGVSAIEAVPITDAGKRLTARQGGFEPTGLPGRVRKQLEAVDAAFHRAAGELLEARKPPQRFRIFIHGHSFRHVFGTHDQKAIAPWLADLHRGKQPGFRAGAHDWSVEYKHPQHGWVGLPEHSRRTLVQAVRRHVEGHQREALIDDAFFTGAAEYLLEAGRGRRVGSALSSSEHAERVVAAQARWRGHAKSVPAAPRQPGAQTAKAVRGARASVTSMGQLSPELRQAVIHQIGLMPDRHLNAMDPGDRAALQAQVKHGISEKIKAGATGRQAKTVSGTHGRLAARLNAMAHRENSSRPTPAESAATDGGRRSAWLQGDVDPESIKSLGGTTTNAVSEGTIGGKKVIIKPLHGQRTNGYGNLTQGQDLDRELIAPEIADALGNEGFARTAIRDIPGHGIAGVQQFIAPGGENAGDDYLDKHTPQERMVQLAEIALFDAATGNMDRHLNNLKVAPYKDKDGKVVTDVYPIDHGCILPNKPGGSMKKGQSMAVEAQLGRDLEPFEVERLKKLQKNKKLFAKIEDRVPGSAAPMQKRIQMLLDHGHYPAWEADFKGGPRPGDLTMENFLAVSKEPPAAKAAVKAKPAETPTGKPRNTRVMAPYRDLDIENVNMKVKSREGHFDPQVDSHGRKGGGFTHEHREHGWIGETYSDGNGRIAAKHPTSDQVSYHRSHKEAVAALVRREEGGGAPKPKTPAPQPKATTAARKRAVANVAEKAARAGAPPAPEPAPAPAAPPASPAPAPAAAPGRKRWYQKMTPEEARAELDRRRVARGYVQDSSGQWRMPRGSRRRRSR
jgi:GNAT superfamily N-acetyltransferase